MTRRTGMLRTLLLVTGLVLVMLAAIGGQRLVSARAADALAGELIDPSGQVLADPAAVTAAIHATDGAIAWWTFGILGAGGATIMVLVVALTRRSVRNQVAPLRATTEQIIASGDHSLRLEPARRGEIAALGHTLNAMLDSMAEQAAEVARGQAEREQRVIEAHIMQAKTEEQLRERAQERIDATVTAVVGELSAVLAQADQVQAAASDILEGARSSEQITGQVLGEAAQADAALGELVATMAEVHGIVATIQKITEQTRMLALNANIEAARAGAAGAGFTVVANEVGSLASDTARSAAGIAATTERVGETAGRVSATLAGVTSRVTEVGSATDRVRSVAGYQGTTVAALAAAVRDAMGRVESMGQLSDDLERREHTRFPAFGSVQLVIAGVRHQGTLRDISAGGMEVGLPDRLMVSQGTPVAVTLPPELGGAEVRMKVAWHQEMRGSCRAGLECQEGCPRLEREAMAWSAQFVD